MFEISNIWWLNKRYFVVIKSEDLFNLCFRPQSQCLASVQSQASSLAYHLSRYPSFNDQHLTKDVFYNHHHPSNSTNCSLTPYGSAVRPASSYTSGSDQTEQGLDAQTAAQILDPAEGFGFVGAGMNPAGGGCQGQTYSSAGHSGKGVSDCGFNVGSSRGVCRSLYEWCGGVWACRLILSVVQNLGFC